MSHPYFTYPRSTPWFSWDEWSSVHAGLFSSNPSEVSWALDVVEAWMLRGRCPHSVETTAHLASYLLKSPSYSPLEARLLASTIIVRAVNGLVEPLQQRVHADSVMSLAAKLGIPPWIVELRHAATHDKLPSLANLRLAASTLLNWLNENYWQPQAAKLRQMHDACLQFIQPKTEEELLLNGYTQAHRITTVIDSVTAVSSVFAPAVIHCCAAYETSREWLEFVLQCTQRLEQVWGSAFAACVAHAFDRLFWIAEHGQGDEQDRVQQAHGMMALLQCFDASVRSTEPARRILPGLRHRWDEIQQKTQDGGLTAEVGGFISSYLQQDDATTTIAMNGHSGSSKAAASVQEKAGDEDEIVECSLPLWPLGSMPGHLTSSLHLVTYDDHQQQHQPNMA